MIKKGLRAASIYSHCTSDPRNPYHNLLAPVTRNCTIFTLTSYLHKTTQCGDNHPVSFNMDSEQPAVVGVGVMLKMLWDLAGQLGNVSGPHVTILMDM